MLGTLHALSLLFKGRDRIRRVGRDSAQASPTQSQSEHRGSLGSGLPTPVPGHCLFPGLPLLHTTPKRAAQHYPVLDALWSHPVNNWLCDLGQGTSLLSSIPLLQPLQAVTLKVSVQVMFATSLGVTWAAVAVCTPHSPTRTHPGSLPAWSCWEEHWVQSVSRDGRFPVVAKGTSGLSLQCSHCGRSGGGEAGPPRRNLCSRPSPPQCSQLSKRLVQFVTLGPECTVCFIWPLSSPTLAALYLYFLLQPWRPAVSYPCSHLPTASGAPCPLMGQETSLLPLPPPPPRPWVLNACGGWEGGVQRELWRGEVGLRKGECPRPLSRCHHPALKLPPKLWSLQIGSAGPTGP
nr:uncharacterized protein LOC105861434 [Microcebus murinus]